MSAIEFRGLDDIVDNLESVASTEAIQQALTRACLLVERSAKQKAPKGRTGELRRSIKSEVQELEGVVYTPLEYAPYVEFGTGLFAENGGRTDVPWCYKDEVTDEFIWTSGQHPQPYMRPALDENREEIKRILREALFSND